MVVPSNKKLSPEHNVILAQKSYLMITISLFYLLYTPPLLRLFLRKDDKMAEKNLERAGALWQNLSEKGNIYFNMDLDGRRYVVLANNFKEEEKQPDFIVYERKKEDDNGKEQKTKAKKK